MARKAEREAQQQAVDAYMKQWKKLKRIEGIQERKLGTRTKREVEDQLGDNASYESKRLAMKADKLGKVLNKLQPKFKEDADAYNRRYDEFQRQMNNQSVSSGFLKEKQREAQSEYESLKSAREAAQREKNAKPFSNMSGMSPMGGSGSSPYNEVMGHYQPTKAENEAMRMAHNTSAFYGPITTWRKTLPAHEQAAKDFNELGDKVAGNKQYQQTAAEYKELAERLKNRLRRDVPVKAPQGLLAQAGEVMGANSNPVAGETIG